MFYGKARRQEVTPQIKGGEQRHDSDMEWGLCKREGSRGKDAQAPIDVMAATSKPGYPTPSAMRG